MTQPALDFTADTSLPIAGKTPQARHASSTGAMAERDRRGRFALVYRELLIKAGPLSDQEASRITGRAVSTLNSTRAAFGDRIRPSGTYEIATFADGRSTRRVRWQWVTDQGETQA
jgi:hypothetical protein